MRARATVCVKHFPFLECKRVCLHLELFVPISSSKLQSHYPPPTPLPANVVLMLCPSQLCLVFVEAQTQHPQDGGQKVDPQTHLEVIKDALGGEGGGGGGGVGRREEGERDGEENTISFPTHRHSLSIMENLSQR